MRSNTVSLALFVFGVPASKSFVLPSAPITAKIQEKTSTTQIHLFDQFFKAAEEKLSPGTPPPPPKREAVVIDPDFRVAGLFLAVGALLDTIPYIQFLLGLPISALGILFLVQTFRIRFIFDEDDNLELTMGDGNTSTGENIVVGGANKWACSSIVNYDFFPSGWIDNNPVGPILVYFKETQTDSSKWNEGPGASANDPEKIAAGSAVPGQVHFFPAVCNANQIRDEFEKRQCGKIVATE